jgi:hypothetical protein
MSELGEQISSKVTDGVKTVSDNVIVRRNQILAEKESNLLNTNYFLQRMHCLLKPKILQFVFKCFT